MNKPSEKYTILVVDDSAPIRLWLRKHLHGEFEVVEAHNCHSAKAMLSSKKCNMMIVDDSLADISGVEFSKQLREQEPYTDLPIIMITANSEEHFIAEAFGAGINDFIRKPLNYQELRARISMAQRFKETEERVNDLIEELRDRSEKDPLTQVSNRFVLEHDALREIAKTVRSGEDLSLLMFDIDGFKSINDGWGHLAGDQVLVEFSRLLRENLRKYDVISRYGGDEFVVLLPYTNGKQAQKVAEKLLQSVRECNFSTEKGIIPVTISVGVAALRSLSQLDDQDSLVLDALLSAADEALYRAKREGKNRCCSSSGSLVGEVR